MTEAALKKTAFASSTSFETKYGQKINLIPEVEGILYPNTQKGTDFYEQMLGFESYAYEMEDNIGRKIEIQSIVNDLITFAQLIDFMQEIEAIPPGGFRKALDIAGAEGVHAAFFRGLYAEQCDVADLLDGTDPAFSSKLKSQLRRFKIEKVADYWLHHRPRLAKAVQKMTGKNFRRGLKRLNSTKHINVPSFENFYNFNFKRQPKVDAFHVGNWFESVQDTYDAIINFQSFWLWDHHKSFKKIASLLEKGGVFATNAPYHWCGRPSLDSGGLLGGAFPFFEQRLELDDIQKYYQTHKPEYAQYVEKSYNSTDPARPTITQYIKTAAEHGLICKGYKRIYFRAPYNLYYKGACLVRSLGIQLQIDVDAEEVLRDIHQFRQDVELEDLMTRAVIMVFEKC